MSITNLPFEGLESLPLVEKGDLVFGISSERSLFLAQQNSSRISIHEVIVDSMICNQANHHTKRLESKDYESEEDNIFTIGGETDEAAPEELTPESKDFDAYAISIEKAKIESKVIKKFGELIPSEVEKEERYFYTGETTDYELLMLEKNPFIKSRCKIGLIWALFNHHKVHFILEGLDVKAAFSKFGELGTSYTAHEIRSLYRLFRNRLLSSDQESNVKFYNKDIDGTYREQEAPWKTDPSLMQYEPKSLGK